MTHRTISFGLLLLAAAVAVACVPKRELDRKTREADACYQALRKENQAKRDLQAEQEALRASNETYEALLDKLEAEIKEQLVQIRQEGRKTRVTLSERILFDSGSTHLVPAGMSALSKVAGVLADEKGRRIEVIGHTDSVPIVPPLTRKYETNWELSAARATRVIRFLSDQGVDPRQMRAVGAGMYEPVAPNTTARGRQLNRRIEILLAPVSREVATSETSARAE